ncbi:MAG: hypothetical protein MSJ26_02070 [Oscillospiraceae bacterium]|nr:hypothetical protein [Oscillospiraceae bacterium]
MQSYGYVLSGLARHDRFNEAEWLLDKVLKGFSKGSKQFEEDGSISLTYSKNDENGEKLVTLKRNVTESCIMVLSDIPLKFFRFGGWIFYLRDLIPTLAFFLLYGIFGVRFNSVMINSNDPFNRLFGIVGGALAALLLNLITVKLFKKNRSFDRICFIQAGGIFSAFMILYVGIKSSGKGIWDFWTQVLSCSPFIEAVGGVVLARLLRISSQEDSNG